MPTTAPAPRAALLRRSPDRLDRPLRLSASLAAFSLAVLVAAAVAAAIWSFVSTAPVKVQAQGLILSRLGVSDVTANAAGRVTALKVEVGDRVVAGQVVAEISQPDLGETLKSKTIELEARKTEREQIRRLATRTFEIAERQRARRREAIDVRIASLTSRLATMREIEANTKGLLASGVTTLVRALETTNERSRTENDLNDARSQLITLQAEAEDQKARDERELLRADIAVAAAERELAVTRANLSRSDTVLAQRDGQIVEVNVNLGEPVQIGAAIMRMLPGSGAAANLEAVVFVAGGGGKRVRPGMQAQIVPATVRLQRDGFIEGLVVAVSDLPATRESMMRVLKNAAFVDQLTKAGLPYEATVALATDPASPTGLRWSTGTGPASPIGLGTVTEARIVVDRVPIIGLVIPRAETLMLSVRRWTAALPAVLPAWGR
ncbi:NHLP bacteriocin system secretion protein [Methylobacterium aquaticum]|uniref:Uncharacterized protein n=1 Tax=Methylobacterium aquaticum TaxID=270351 RepID=A0A0J6SM81_9HYPH|nr:NHLP bacteriocin system secretion protein [Methylobacterium aquaticum]KMO36325.1 hypothetical protein VP06_10105 [Methylobacterium aquaticum]